MLLFGRVAARSIAFVWRIVYSFLRVWWLFFASSGSIYPLFLVGDSSDFAVSLLGLWFFYILCIISVLVSI